MALLDGIVRVSKTGEREYLRSPDQQEADLRAWAKREGHELAVVHRAIDESAGHGGHPAIEAAKERALAGQTDGVVAPYLSRFTRNTVYGLETVQELLDAGREFFALDCPFDLRTPEGEKFLTDKLADARYEWRVRRENFGRGVREAIERGVHLRDVFGYQRSNGKGSPLAINDREAKVVWLAFEMRAQGHTWQAIAQAMNATGVMPRPYKRDKVVQQAQWTHKTARQLVVGREGTGNRVYIGTAWNGAHETPEAHPAIVDPALFRRANGTKGTKPVGPDDGYLLSGLVRCATCGYVMNSGWTAGRRYFRCQSSQHGNGRCIAPANAPAEALETHALEEFMARYNVDAEAVAADDVVSAAEADRDAVLARMANFAAYVASLGETSPAERKVMDRQTAELRAELNAAETHVERAQSAARRANLPNDLTVRTMAAESIPQQRHYLSLVFAAVVVRPARRWREPVEHRSRVVLRDEAPDGSTRLIPFVAALDW